MPRAISKVAGLSAIAIIVAVAIAGSLFLTTSGQPAKATLAQTNSNKNSTATMTNIDSSTTFGPTTTNYTKFSTVVATTDSSLSYVSSGPCGTYPNGLQTLMGDVGGSAIGILAFAMNLSSTAKLCVSYVADAAQYSNDFSEIRVNFSAEANIVNATPSGNGFEYSYSPARNISIGAQPSTVLISNGSARSEITVEYTINAGQFSKGFYTLSTFMQCPPLIAFAVGFTPQELNGTDFAGFYLEGSCTLQLPMSGYEITGFSGMSAVYVSGP